MKGAQWLSGRVLDFRPKGRGFEPHRHHGVVSLSKNINPSLVLVQPRKTCPFITERLLMGRKESIQTNTMCDIYLLTKYSYADPENSSRKVGGFSQRFVFSYQFISQRVVWTSYEKQLDPWGPIASLRRSIPEFQKKPINTYDCPGAPGHPVVPPLDPPMIIWVQ